MNAFRCVGSERPCIDFESSLSEVIVLPRLVVDDNIGHFGDAALVGGSYLLREFLKFASCNRKVEREVVYHLSLHEVDIAKFIKTLPNDRPTLVRVSIVADYLA